MGLHPSDTIMSTLDLRLRIESKPDRTRYAFDREVWTWALSVGEQEIWRGRDDYNRPAQALEAGMQKMSDLASALVDIVGGPRTTS